VNSPVAAPAAAFIPEMPTRCSSLLALSATSLALRGARLGSDGLGSASVDGGFDGTPVVARYLLSGGLLGSGLLGGAAALAAAAVAGHPED
jgi:hypothetical protein